MEKRFILKKEEGVARHAAARAGGRDGHGGISSSR
jgi:hypothetical protein